MTRKPTYEDLEQRIRVLEEESIKDKQAEFASWKSEKKIVFNHGKSVMDRSVTITINFQQGKNNGQQSTA